MPMMIYISKGSAKQDTDDMEMKILTAKARKSLLGLTHFPVGPGDRLIKEKYEES